MIHPFWFWLGYCTLRIDRARSAEVMEICRRGRYVYRDLSFGEDSMKMKVSRWSAKRMIRIGRERGIDMVMEKEYGLPALLSRYRCRVGIAIGLLLFGTIIFGSGRVVWSVRIEGNDRLDSGMILEQLSACGLEIGGSLRELETDVIENRMLILSDEISWISINLNGTVAHVEVRETLPEVDDTKEFAASNLVANRTGRIEMLEDIRGNLAVSIGDTVAKGELLVGGLYDSELGGLRYTRARGRVLAETERSFLVQIPLKNQKKVYTEQTFLEKYWIFFKKEGKIFANTKKFQGDCDIINTVEYFKLWGGVTLPFGIRTVRVLPYELCEEERDAETVVELALRELRARMQSEVPDGQLVRKEMRSEWRDGVYLLRCRANYIENIAVEKEIEIQGIS